MNNAQYIPNLSTLAKPLNAAGGLVSLDGNGDLVGPIVNRSMTYDELMNGVVPEVGELVYCSDTYDLHIGDGVTIGGRFHSAPSIDRTLLNSYIEIKDTTGLTICDIPCKAGCLYEISAIVGLLDRYTVTNNWKLSLPWGKAQSLAVAGTPFHGALAVNSVAGSAYWYESLLIPTTRMTCAVSLGANATTLSASPGDPVAAGTSAIILKAAMKFSADVTASIMLSQVETQSLGVEFRDIYSSIGTRRIA